MAKQHILKVVTSIRTIDSKRVDYRQNRWPSVAAALAGIPVNGVETNGIFYPGRTEGLTVPVIENGRTVLYWWDQDLTDAGFVPFLGTIKTYIDNSIIALQDDLEAQIEDLRNEVNTEVLHTSAATETKEGRLILLTPPTIPTGVADTDAVNVAQMLQLPNDIRFQRIQKTIPTIQKTVSGAGKCMEFLRIVPTNNYCYTQLSVTANGCVKTYDFVTGYDSLSTTDWARLQPIYVLRDRDYVDFEIEIKKIAGFGPLNAGVEMRFHQTLGGTNTVTIKVDFALELPWWVGGTDLFVVLNNEYDFSGTTSLYGRKLTMTPDGRNWEDDQGQEFVKDGSQLILDLQNYKADTSYVNARLQIVEEDVEHIEEVLLPLKQDKSVADSNYAEILQRLEFLQTQLDSIPDSFEITAAMIAALPLVTSQEELDALAVGTPYRSQGFVKYKIEDGVFGAEFDDTFGGGDTGEEPEEYSGIFAETFGLEFEL